MNHLLALGHGYVARHLAPRLRERGWRVTGTSRSAERAASFDHGVEGVVFDGSSVAPALTRAVASASHLLVSIGPEEGGDPVVPLLGPVLDRALGGRLRWVGYLSTTGVYGDHGGGWVDESTPPRPGLERTRRRRAAEEAWEALVAPHPATLQIFRLSGIYGPDRNPLDGLRDGSARRIVKEGNVSNRVHVDDIVQAVLAGIDHPEEGGVFNVSDDLPVPTHEVVAYGAGLLGMEPPEAVPFQEAGLSAMGRSFYEEDRRVRNDRIKEVLGVRLRHPTYREGLQALLGR